MYRLLVAVLLLWGCGEYEEFAQVKVASSRDPAVVMVNRLFTMLIGRMPTVVERQPLVRGYSDAARRDFYQQVLDKILSSEVYHQEGFAHLHRQRLLLAQQGTDMFLFNSQRDYDALQLELRDLSYVDNYWDIFAYRQRWLPVQYLQLSSCVSWLRIITQEQQVSDNVAAKVQELCRKFLQASLDPTVEHFFYSQQQQQQPRFVNLYAPRCCPQAQDNICLALDANYQQLYRTSFCVVAKRKTSADQQAARWDTDKMLVALALVISLRLSEGQDFLVAVSLPEVQLQRYRAEGDYNLKVTVPELLQGVHASPFWLAQHASSQKNRDLHRARLIYHSWFCASISPDNAQQSDPNPLIPAVFAPYFADDDRHTREFGSCFNCHKLVQPLANYFGQLSDGVDYQQPDLDAKTSLAQRFFNLTAPYVRQGGFYDDRQGRFFPWGQQLGMAGLAALLSNLPRVRRCLVNATWNGFFGRQWHLQDDEVEAGVEAFVASNFNYRQLLRYLLTREQAIIYFTEGAQAFYAAITQERTAQQLTCAQAKVNDYGITASQVLRATCAACHAGNAAHAKFLAADKSFAVSDATYVRTIYQRVAGLEQPHMPPEGQWFSPAQAETFALQKKVLTCFLEEQAAARGVSLPDAVSQNNNVSADEKFNLLHDLSEVRR